MYKILAIGLLIFLILYGIPAVLADGGGTIRYNQTIAGDLAPGEVDTWTFRGEAGDRVVISAERFPPDPTAQLDPYLELYAPDGSLLGADDNRGVGLDALLLGLELPEDGLYAIKMSSDAAAWADGSYQITIAANTLAADCENWEGSWTEGDFESAIARPSLHYRIYLPPCHETETVRYPYLVLLHGSAMSDSHWDRLGIDDAVMRGVALGRFPPIAIALPFGDRYANLNVFQAGNSYESILLDEFIPFIETNYCVIAEPEGRAIGGISRGGFWAYSIGLRHPELFEAVGGHSPFFDLYHAPDTHNPLALALTVDPDSLPRLWMDRGKFDYAQYYIDIMEERLVEHKVPHQFILYETGEHRDDYWQAHIDDYLGFYTQSWRDWESYPICEPAE